MSNTNLTAGDGTIVVNPDTIGGISYPRAKLVWGPSGTVNDADVASGKPLPVQLRGSDGTDRSNSLPISGTVKVNFGTATAFTKANANIGTSATAGWKSNAIDNTSTKALDALVTVELAAVNTAPAGTKSLYIYAYGLIAGSAYTGTGAAAIDGTEGTVTFPSFSTLASPLKLIGVVPYPVQNVAVNGGPFSVAAAFGGVLPDKWGIAVLNDTGMTLSVTNYNYQEITNTVG